MTARVCKSHVEKSARFRGWHVLCNNQDKRNIKDKRERERKRTKEKKELKEKAENDI